MEPLILYSLPRSGSTLLQRMLANHPQIATAAEPWLLLPLVYAMRSMGSQKIYEQSTACDAITDFSKTLPEAEDTYFKEVGTLARRLYAASSRDRPSARYFLDKTPRYHLIAPEIDRIFDDVRYIIAWRHPLAVAASIMETWANGRWNLHHYEVDLFTGLANLVETQRRLGDRALVVRYETLVQQPSEECSRLCDYLGIPSDDEMHLLNGVAPPAGRMGDKTGVAKHQQVSTDSLNSWRATFCNPIRKQWARRYLTWIGVERLQLMGYELGVLMESLNAIPSSARRLGSDVLRITNGWRHRRRYQREFGLPRPFRTEARR